MTFVTVADKSVGDAFTEAMWDTFIRDNLNKGVNRPIQEVILGADAATIDFTSIDQNFAHLKLVVYGRTDRASIADDVGVRFNADTGANYYAEQLVAAGATATAAEALATTSCDIASLPGNTALANFFGSLEILIPYYTGITNKKSLIALASYPTNTTTGTVKLAQTAGHWNAAPAAINRVTLVPFTGTNFKAGTRATLIGLAAA